MNVYILYYLDVNDKLIKHIPPKDTDANAVVLSYNSVDSVSTLLFYQSKPWCQLATNNYQVFFSKLQSTLHIHPIHIHAFRNFLRKHFTNT